MKLYVRLGLIALIGLLTSCASTTSLETATPTADSASSTRPGVTAASFPSTTVTQETDSPPPSTGARVMTAASCVSEYSTTILAQRNWAFDGTLISVGVLKDSHLGSIPSATFSVNHWYRGGTGDQVTVQFEMGQISEFVPQVEAGVRLLVTGEPRWGGQPLDDPVAWGCGFTQPWTADAAASWANAFAA